jgi:hypothetical protein
MTALTVSAGPEQDAGPRPLPWQRMAWVTWRQHRFALGGVAVFIGAIAVCLWIVGLQLHHAYTAAIAACQQPSSLSCLGPATVAGQIGGAVGKFDGMDDFLANGGILQVVPVLIGAFVGAPVLARELETGTFRYAWTQGFGRWRWTLSKLVLLAVGVAAAAGALSVVLYWYYQPYFNAGNQPLELTETTPFFPALSTCAGSRSPAGRWSPSRSPAWQGCSSAASSPRSPPPWPSTLDSPSRPGRSCASITCRRWSPAT